MPGKVTRACTTAASNLPVKYRWIQSLSACPPISRRNSRPTSGSVQLPVHARIHPVSNSSQCKSQPSLAHNLSHPLHLLLFPPLTYDVLITNIAQLIPRTVTDMEPLLRSRSQECGSFSPRRSPTAHPPRIAFTRRCRSVLGLAGQTSNPCPPATWVPSIPSLSLSHSNVDAPSESAASTAKSLRCK